MSCLIVSKSWLLGGRNISFIQRGEQSSQFWLWPQPRAHVRWEAFFECIGKYRWIWGTVHNIALDSRVLCNRKCIGGRRLAGLQWTPMTANAPVLQFNLYRSMSSPPTSFFSCFFNIVNDKGSFTEHHKGWNFVEVQVHSHFLGRCQIFESTLLPVFMSRITFVGILSLW